MTAITRSLFLLATISSLVGALPTATEHFGSISLHQSNHLFPRGDTIIFQNFHLPADEFLAHNVTTSFTDAFTLVGKVLETTAWENTEIFDHYFPPEARGAVASVFQEIPGRISGVVFDNDDLPDGADPQHRALCVAERIAAYTVNPNP
ncbi:MAG: hypothetical protein L6R40_001357 [Gallowayella cf. fulva]|nr:MAG: hypothetical protein L6R40_001357 [Xanthomendoza cf. fulva]